MQGVINLPCGCFGVKMHTLEGKKEGWKRRDDSFKEVKDWESSFKWVVGRETKWWTGVLTCISREKIVRLEREVN